MNKILSILVFWVSFTYINAQDITKFYKQSIHTEGLLYFVYPQKMSIKKGESSNICKKDLSYDYTYLDSRDSVTILMTIATSVPYKPHCIEITYNSGTQKSSVSGNSEILYVESQKKNWITRVRTTIGYNEWVNMYKSPIPITVSFSSDTDIQKIEYMDSQKRWKKVSMKFIRLFQLIDYNN